MTTLHAKIVEQVKATGKHLNPEAGDRVSLRFVKNYTPLMGDVIINGELVFEFYERKDGSVRIATPE